MNIILVLTILFIHWFADFVCQTDWEAKNKSTNNEALTQHVFTYSMIWLILTVIYAGFTTNPLLWWFAPITFVCHWCTDYVTSRNNTKLYKQGKIHEFFVSVGFDQFLHYVQLLITFKLLT